MLASPARQLNSAVELEGVIIAVGQIFRTKLRFCTFFSRLVYRAERVLVSSIFMFFISAMR